jgi:hypothetical protein
MSSNTIVPPISVLYSKGDVNINLAGTIVGNVIAPYGSIKNNNNGRIIGLAYADNYTGKNSSIVEGGCVFFHLGNFFNDSMVIQNPDVLPPNLPPGLSSEASTGGLNINNYQEVYQ